MCSEPVPGTTADAAEADESGTPCSPVVRRRGLSLWPSSQAGLALSAPICTRSPVKSKMRRSRTILPFSTW